MGEKCRVFDDPLSLIHAIVGFTVAAFGQPALLLASFIVYVLYEVLEGRYKRDCPGADILEFLVGVGGGALLRAVLSLGLRI